MKDYPSITVRVTMRQTGRWYCDYCEKPWESGDDLIETGIGTDVVHGWCWQKYHEEQMMKRLSK